MSHVTNIHVNSGNRQCIQYIRRNIPEKSFVNLFDEIDALLKVHAEVDELPLDAFLLVLLLLENEHVMVEELLQTLIGVVDAQLLERVVLSTNN